MSTTTYRDLVVVHRYIDEISTFIGTIVPKESIAVVLACKVFEAHHKRAAIQSFESEEIRLLWLRRKSLIVALQYLNRKEKESYERDK